MKKKILVLTGSPRRGGNSDTLVECFKRGAESAGHEVTIVHTAEKKIGGCTACCACYSDGKPCVFDDDFNALAPVIESAEVLVFATPIYWYTFPAQLKAAIDKMYALYVGKRDWLTKECLLLVCGEDSNVSAFDGIQRSYDSIWGLMEWENRGTLIVPDVNDIGDIEGHEALQKAETLGKAL